jgi:iron complex transport system substrate-binding protein
VRIVSLLPAATEILLAIGLEEELAGVTHRCEIPPECGDPPVLTRRGPGDPVDVLDRDALFGAQPDLVIVGDGDDGTIGARAVEAVLASFAAAAEDAGDGTSPAPSILTLAPSTVEGVLNGIVAVGAMTEAEDEALGVVEGLRERLKGTEEIVVGRRDHGFQPPRLILLGAVDPPRTVGRWVPDQVRLAGGWELLGQDGGRAESTTWAAVRDMDPEVLVLLPDGLPLPEAIRAWEATERPEGWADLRAVREDRVFVVDGPCFTLAGPRVLDGIEILAELIDPAAFDGMSPPATWARAR